jgi:putative CocE/NonD family hydrolase
MRDGANLQAVLYSARSRPTPTPVIVAMTPYIGQSHHDVATYFAAHGYRFLCVDIRGRGNSDGLFNYSSSEAKDGHDLVEWLAQQPYCDGRVAMWGGSYAGYAQWATASQRPAHLSTIVPVASPYRGVDAPMHNNTFGLERLQWLLLVAGRTSQEKIFGDASFWRMQFRAWFEAGLPFKQLDAFLGYPSTTFQEWLSHPQQDRYWDDFNPSSAQYGAVSVPILTITGIYDVSQAGALAHYRRHLEHASPEARAHHYLVIGPWDHAGTRVPAMQFGGLTVGPDSCIDLLHLHVQWYDWTMQGGPRPPILEKNVVYYVTGAEQWRCAESLEAITARSVPYYLHSGSHATDVLHSGRLDPSIARGSPDQYVYDPRDVSLAALETTIDSASLVDQRLLHAAVGKQLVYHSAPLDEATEICGFFRLGVWLAIDQPDTDFRISVHEVRLDGSSVLLATDCLRARYRTSLREAQLVRTDEPLHYQFERFNFTARTIGKGHRLRLVIGPINSIYYQKNYNSGGAVSEESMQDARAVTVKLFHDELHPSALYVPYGRKNHDALNDRSTGRTDTSGQRPGTITARAESRLGQLAAMDTRLQQ